MAPFGVPELPTPQERRLQTTSAFPQASRNQAVVNPQRKTVNLQQNKVDLQRQVLLRQLRKVNSQQKTSANPFPPRARYKQWQDGEWDVSEWDAWIATFPEEIREYIRVLDERDEGQREDEYGVNAVERRRRVVDEGRYVSWQRYWER